MIEGQSLLSQDHRFRDWCREKMICIRLGAGRRDLERGLIGSALGYLRECSSIIAEIQDTPDYQTIPPDYKRELDLLLCEAKSMQILQAGIMITLNDHLLSIQIKLLYDNK